MSNNIKAFAILIIIPIWIIAGLYFFNYSLKVKELQIKKETYISTLVEQYNRDLQSCRNAILKESKKKGEELTAEIQTKCIEPINKSRTAKLLESWGYSDLLMK